MLALDDTSGLAQATAAELPYNPVSCCSNINIMLRFLPTGYVRRSGCKTCSVYGSLILRFSAERVGYDRRGAVGICPTNVNGSYC